MILLLAFNPEDIVTAQQKGERVVRGFIHHFTKPTVIKSVRAIRKAIMDNYDEQGFPFEQAYIKAKHHKGMELHRVCARLFSIEKDKPVRVFIEYAFPCLASASKKTKAQDQWHFKRPDLDNLTKSVLDALTDLRFFNDDGQVCELVLRKKRLAEGHSPNILIKVEQVDEEPPLTIPF